MSKDRMTIEVDPEEFPGSKESVLMDTGDELQNISTASVLHRRCWRRDHATRCRVPSM